VLKRTPKIAKENIKKKSKRVGGFQKYSCFPVVKKAGKVQYNYSSFKNTGFLPTNF
jgi:hypothetical protein